MSEKQIQWYPGHMAKANRLMKEQLKLIDFLIEVRDARIPNSSSNPNLKEMANNKPRLIILNKADKANSDITNKWINYFQSNNEMVLAINALKNSSKKDILNASEIICAKRKERQIKKGMKPTPMKAMVVGIPNVGKSTIINMLAGKKIASTANHPGVTKKITWIKVSDDFYLLDTPGVLWPKFDDHEVAIRLAITGAIKDEILPINDIYQYAITYLINNYPLQLQKRYNIDLPLDSKDALEKIATSKGFLLKGGNIDEEKVKKYLLTEIRNDVFGNISWENI